MLSYKKSNREKWTQHEIDLPRYGIITCYVTTTIRITSGDRNSGTQIHFEEGIQPIFLTYLEVTSLYPCKDAKAEKEQMLWRKENNVLTIRYFIQAQAA